jgi:hypothetical protein
MGRSRQVNAERRQTRARFRRAPRRGGTETSALPPFPSHTVHSIMHSRQFGQTRSRISPARSSVTVCSMVNTSRSPRLSSTPDTQRSHLCDGLLCLAQTIGENLVTPRLPVHGSPLPEQGQRIAPRQQNGGRQAPCPPAPGARIPSRRPAQVSDWVPVKPPSAPRRPTRARRSGPSSYPGAACARPERGWTQRGGLRGPASLLPRRFPIENLPSARSIHTYSTPAYSATWGRVETASGERGDRRVGSLCSRSSEGCDRRGGVRPSHAGRNLSGGRASGTPRESDPLTRSEGESRGPNDLLLPQPGGFGAW